MYEYRLMIRVTFGDGSVGEAEERIPLHIVLDLPALIKEILSDKDRSASA